MRGKRALTRFDIDLAMRAPAGLPQGDRATTKGSLRRAAVLCPIIPQPAGLSVILTLRADNLRAHPGQISFPGGKIEQYDRSPLEAALREAEEEIGLPSTAVDVSGSLEPYSTGTGFLVTPFVGIVDPKFKPVPDPEEVAEVFEVPLDFVMNRANYQRESYTYDGMTRDFYVIMFGDYRIWGATAGMLRMLADRVAALD